MRVCRDLRQRDGRQGNMAEEGAPVEKAGHELLTISASSLCRDLHKDSIQFAEGEPHFPKELPLGCAKRGQRLGPPVERLE